MDLNAVRERINAIDDQIVDLFVERMKASADVASAKAEKNLPVLDLRREQAVLEKVMERGGEEFEIYINKLYQTIFDIGKGYQAGLLTKNSAFENSEKTLYRPSHGISQKAVVACPGRGGGSCGKSMRQIVCIAQQDVFQQLRVYSMRWNPRSVQIWRAAIENSSTRLCNRGL